MDSGLNGGISASFIATDNEGTGWKAGDYLRKAVPPSATVAIISFVKGMTTALEHRKGVKGSLRQAAGLHVLDTLFSDSTIEQAYDVTKKLLQNNPGISGIIGLNETSTVGAVQAVKDWGMRLYGKHP